jgi:hypothetical protein
MYEPPALFVAWREPESRRILPVGRLLRVVAPLRGYEFGYIEGARIAEEVGFQPFVTFPNLDEVYRSRELLPFFKNRVLSASRPDYPDYIETLALDAQVAEPMTLLGVSGGRRATDRIEIFPDWMPASCGARIQTRLLVRGVQYIEGAEERIAQVHAGDHLECVRDTSNPINPRAIVLRAKSGEKIGYVPDYLTSELAPLLESGIEIDVRVQRVNPPPAPQHLRVLCILSVPEASGIVGYRSSIFRPISAKAMDIGDCVSSPVPPAVAAG